MSRFKQYVQHRLEKYVIKYFKKYHPTLIVVVGSVGKTTTKTAIATVLAKRYRVQMEPSNHNSELSVPLAIMGVKYPPADMLHSVKTWRSVFKAMKQRINAPQGVDVIVQELGTDKPGDLAVFERYLHPDIAVVTSVAPEHMENFPNGLTDVAREELSIAKYANLTIVNHDDIDDDFASFAETNNITDYGLDGGEYRFDITGGTPLDGYHVRLFAPEFGGASVDRPELAPADVAVPAVIHLGGAHNIKAACAAAADGARMGIPASELVASLSEIRPVAGRMNPLPGVRGSTIIDDTYNSSPIAALAALDTIYQIEAPQRIAILGSMNELGNYSVQAHQQVGLACDPMKLDFVITIGEEAARYLAPAAKSKGNTVFSFSDPISAGTYANQQLQKGGLVLVKGSQNGVFAEEATKVLLRNIEDKDNLVRQDADWMKKKNDWLSSLKPLSTNIDNE